MKICLIDNKSPQSHADGAGIYVAQLAPALAEQDRVSILSVAGGLPNAIGAAMAVRRTVIRQCPDIVHLNNLSGLTLLVALWSIGERPALAMTVHDYRLLERGRQLNRSLTNRLGLVISPSHYALEAHTREGFFRPAIKLVLPYAIDARVQAAPGNESKAFTRDEPFIFRASWPAPFPVAIQDAFRSGRVVIATRTGGIPEMVRHEVNGLLVEPGDDVAVAAAIERLRQSPEFAARLRTSALETARLYDMRFHLAQLRDAYRELLTTSRAGDLDHRAA